MQAFDFLKDYPNIFGLDPQAVYRDAAEAGGTFASEDWSGVLRAMLAYVCGTAKCAGASVLLLFACGMLGLLIGRRRYAVLALTVACACPAVADLLATAAIAKNGVSDMTALMAASIPALFSLHLSSASAVFLWITQVLGVLMLSVFLPLVLFRSAMGICDSVTERFSVRGVQDALHSVFTWGLGAVMLLFSVTATLSGAVAGAGATVAGRSLRYAGNLVPVVGRYLSESAEMISASASVLRAAGGAGVCIAVIGCAAEPFLHILVYGFLYRLAVWIIRPLASERLAQMVQAVADGMSGLAGITALTASAMLINLAVIVRAVGPG